MNRPLSVSPLVLALSTALYGAGPTLPQQHPPSIGIAAARDGGDLQVIRQVMKLVPEMRTRTSRQIVDGKAVTKEEIYTVSRPVWETQLERFKPGDCQVYRDGVQLDQQAWTELLRQRTGVVISDSGGPLDPFYQQFFKPGTIVVSVRPSRPSTPTAPPQPAPPPLPR